MRRWLFADQLGPHFLDEGKDALLVEALSVFRRRRFHRRKAHLVLSALRHRATELGESTVHVTSHTYAEALADLGEPVEVCSPTSRAADAFVRTLPDVTVLPERGWVMSRADFATWTDGRRQLRMEDYYREVRQRTGLLMQPDGQPVGGRWNYDAENREPPPRGARRLGDTMDVPEPWWPVEDDIDAEVRETLDRWETEDRVQFIGEDGPRRFAVTHEEATAALEHFVTTRLGAFGPYEDAMLAEDPWMAHSLLSVPLNLGLLDPVEVARRAETAHTDGSVELPAVEGFVRQVIGWREYVWHIYWHAGSRAAAEEEDSPGSTMSAEHSTEVTVADGSEPYRDRNALDAHEPLPDWFADLKADRVTARCLQSVLAEVRAEGWTHHIPRLMVLGSWALQRGYDPAALTDWFHRSFVDGYDWVMVPNVVGMSQYADGGLMATKPYTSGGAYINKMSDYCRECAYSPSARVGEDACPFTAGYWSFLHDNRERLRHNHRMARPLGGLDRLSDLDAVLEQEKRRGSDPP
jgi:deoxyribodipyrimidine photolyase-related protein